MKEVASSYVEFFNETTTLHSIVKPNEVFLVDCLRNCFSGAAMADPIQHCSLTQCLDVC